MKINKEKEEDVWTIVALFALGIVLMLVIRKRNHDLALEEHKLRHRRNTSKTENVIVAAHPAHIAIAHLAATHAAIAHSAVTHAAIAHSAATHQLLMAQHQQQQQRLLLQEQRRQTQFLLEQERKQQQKRFFRK